MSDATCATGIGRLRARGPFRPPPVHTQQSLSVLNDVLAHVADEKLLYSVHQAKLSSLPGKHTDTPRNNVLQAIWATHEPVKSTHRIKCHMYTTGNVSASRGL